MLVLYVAICNVLSIILSMVMHSHKLLFRSVTDVSLDGRTVGSVLECELHSIGAHRMDFIVCVCVCE